MNIQFVIDLAFKISFDFRIQQKQNNSILVQFKNEEQAINFVKEITAYEEFNVIRNQNEVLIHIS